jgi:hypothetical protein
MGNVVADHNGRRSEPLTARPSIHCKIKQPCTFGQTLYAYMSPDNESNTTNFGGVLLNFPSKSKQPCLTES